MVLQESGANEHRRMSMRVRSGLAQDLHTPRLPYLLGTYYQMVSLLISQILANCASNFVSTTNSLPL